MAKESCNLIGAPCCKTEITFLYVDFSTKMEVVLGLGLKMDEEQRLVICVEYHCFP